MPVKFIYFDAGFTLIRPHPSVGYHYAQAAAEHGIHVPETVLETAFRTAWKSVRRRYEPLTPVPYGRTEAEAIRIWSDVVGETFRRAGTDAPESPQFFADVFHRFAQGECWQIYNDAPAALDRLERQGIRYGILSNWDARLRPVLRELGLAGRIAALVMSCDVGAEKPAHVIFDAAARVAGYSPECLALIGDEPIADGQGPLAAGWRQCLVHRTTSHPPSTALNHLGWATDLPTAVDRVLSQDV